MAPGGQPCSPAPPHQPPASLIPRPERAAALLAARPGAAAPRWVQKSAVAVAAEAERSERGFVSVAWDTGGIATISSPGMGGRVCRALPTALDGLGPWGTWVSSAGKQLGVRGGLCRPWSPGLGGRVEDEAWAT